MEMWVEDLKLKCDNINIGVFGIGKTAQTFLNAIREQPDFSHDKIKAFYTFENEKKLNTFNGYPILDAKQIESADIDILFFAVGDKANSELTYNKIKPFIPKHLKIVRFNDYINVFQG